MNAESMRFTNPERYIPGVVWPLNPDRKVTPAFVYAAKEADDKIQFGNGLFEPPPLEESEIAEAMARPDTYFYGIFSPHEKNKLDAYLWLQLKANRVYVYALGIDGALQGKGHGAKLLDQTNNIASLHGKSIVDLDVDPTNVNAVSLYAQRNFKPRKIKTYGDATDIPRLHFEKDLTVRQRKDPYMQLVVPVNEIDSMRRALEGDIEYFGATILRDPSGQQAALGLNVDIDNGSKARDMRKALIQSKARVLIAPPVLQSKDVAVRADALTKKEHSTNFTVGSESLHRGSAMGLKRLLENRAIYPSFPRVNMDYDADSKAIIDAFFQNEQVVVGPIILDGNSIHIPDGQTATNKVDSYLNDNTKNECSIISFFRDLKTFAPAITPAALVYEHFNNILREPYFRPLSDAVIISRHESLLTNLVIDVSDKPGRDFYMSRTAEQEQHVDTLIDTLRQSDKGSIEEDPIYKSIVFKPRDDVLTACSEKDREVLKNGISLRHALGNPSTIAWDISYYNTLPDESTQITVRDTANESNYPAEMRLLKKILHLDKLHSISFDSSRISNTIVKQCIAGSLLDELDKIVD